MEPYSEQFIPKLCNVALPKPLTELYDPDSLHLEYLSLLELSEERFQSIKVYLLLLYVSKKYIHLDGFWIFWHGDTAESVFVAIFLLPGLLNWISHIGAGETYTLKHK